MASLNTLEVRGLSRFLNTIYANDLIVANDLTVNGTFGTNGNMSVGGTLAVTGNTTISGTLTLSKTTDLSGTANNSPALIIGGTATGAHIEIDSDEIHAKATGTTTATLNLNTNGGLVKVGSGGLEVGGNLKATGTSTLTTANITTTTVSTGNFTNVNVSNVLRAARYDLQTVGQLGGAFYVSPTVKFPNSNTSVTITKSGTTLTIAITDASITSTTMAGIVWASGIKVKASGKFNNIASGTMDGTVTSINTSSHQLNITVSGENSGSVAAGTYTSSNLSDFYVMAYNMGGETNYPVGIILNSYGTGGRTYIDIYGGTSAETEPNVRIGNLGGLTFNNATLSNQWGIYTNNGYFSGMINANGGKIGGFTIGETAIYTGTITANADNNIGLSTADFTRTVAGSSKTGLRMAFGDKFGLTGDGILYTSNIQANGGNIAGWTISSTSLSKDSSAIDGTIYGAVLSAPTVSPTSIAYAVRSKASSASDWTDYPFVVKYDGSLKATNAEIVGNITATSGYIGTAENGFTIDSSGFYSGTKTANNSGYISLSNANFTRTINDTSVSTLRFAIGSKFGVTNDGTLYANGANIKGINADNITTGTLSIERLSSSIRQDIETALSQGSEYIIGTQTAATGSWTGVSSTLSELKDGTQIRYWLPYAGSGNATLNLTLKDGSQTGAINIYRQGGSANSSGIVSAYRVTTHFPAGSSISMTYGVNRVVSAVYSGTTYTGTFTGWFVDGTYDSGNTYNRVRMQTAIKAVTAITSGRILCGTSAGYKNIAANTAFDLSYPLLYALSNINANATGDNNYLQINGVNASSNGTITSGEANKMLYLKGTVSGNTFTTSASPFMTTVVPTSEDNFIYIPLGIMYSATNIYFIFSDKLYAYKDGSFKELSRGEASLAAKTATNYLYYDSTNGLIISENASGQTYNSASSGYNTQLKSDGLYIRNNSTVLAKYGENITLKSSDDVNYLLIEKTGLDIYNKHDVSIFKVVSNYDFPASTDYVYQIHPDKNISDLNGKSLSGTISFSYYINTASLKYVQYKYENESDFSELDSSLYTSNITLSNGEINYTITFNSNAFTGGKETITDEDIDTTTTSNIVDLKIAFNRTVNSGYYNIGARKSGSAIGLYSTVIGENNSATQSYSVALGTKNTSGGYCSYTLGQNVEASNTYTFGVGYNTKATGYISSSMGSYNTASGSHSFARGYNNVASGEYSFASGRYLNATTKDLTVIGRFNNTTPVYTKSDLLFVIGSGNSTSSRSNSAEMYRNGMIKMMGTYPSLEIIPTKPNTSPQDALDRGGVIVLNPSTNSPQYAGVIIEQYQNSIRFYSIPSKDGSSYTGYGKEIKFDLRAGTITGNHKLNTTGYDSTSITKGSNITVKTGNIIKKNGIVQVYYEFTTTAAISAWGTVGTIPTGYRPLTNTPRVLGEEGGASTGKFFQINTGGNIFNINALTANTTYVVWFTYIANI